VSSSEHDEKPSHGHGGSHAAHGGGGHEEHEGAPEWLISFADNVTLMMGFFVILLAMNLKPASGGEGGSGESGGPPSSPDTVELAIAIRNAFNNPVDPNSADPIDLPLVRRLIERSGRHQSVRDGQIGRAHDVRSIRPSDYFSPAGTIPFEHDSTTLSEEAKEAIRQAFSVFRGHTLIIELRGHVSAAEAFGRKDRGLRLSHDRAYAVAETLVGEGVPWEQLRIVACGDAERLLAVTYEESEHRVNQRVELIVTDQVHKPPVEETTPEMPDSSGLDNHP